MFQVWSFIIITPTNKLQAHGNFIYKFPRAVLNIREQYDVEAGSNEVFSDGMKTLKRFISFVAHSMLVYFLPIK